MEQNNEHMFNNFKKALSSRCTDAINLLANNNNLQKYISNTLKFPKDIIILNYVLNNHYSSVKPLLARNQSLIKYIIKLKRKRENNSINIEEKKIFDLILEKKFINNIIQYGNPTKYQKKILQQILELTTQTETIEKGEIKKHYYNTNEAISTGKQRKELEKEEKTVTKNTVNNNYNNVIINTYDIGIKYTEILENDSEYNEIPDNNKQQSNQLQGALNNFDSIIMNKNNLGKTN